jgi:Family of unknown function (DUF5985)
MWPCLIRRRSFSKFNLLARAISRAVLGRAYVRVRNRLLLWSATCFVGLAISNLLVFLDLVLFPEISLHRWRLITAAIAMLVLVFTFDLGWREMIDGFLLGVITTCSLLSRYLLLPLLARHPRFVVPRVRSCFYNRSA